MRVASAGQAASAAPAAPAPDAGADFGLALRQARGGAGGRSPAPPRSGDPEAKVGGDSSPAPRLGLPGLEPEPEGPTPGAGQAGPAAAAVALGRLRASPSLEIGTPGGLAFLVAVPPQRSGAALVDVLAIAPPALEAAARADLHAVAEALRRGGGPQVRSAVNVRSAGPAPTRPRPR